MRIDQKKVRSALVAAFEVDRLNSLIGTPLLSEATEMVRLALEAEIILRNVSISNGQSSNHFVTWSRQFCYGVHIIWAALMTR